MLDRRQCLLGTAGAFAALGYARTAGGQGAWGVAWMRAPTVTILGTPGDTRVRLVHEGVAFWNGSLAGIGSALRLGPVTEIAGALPPAELSALSEAVLRRAGPGEPPPSVLGIPGVIVVALSDGDFISFAARWPGREKALVAIKNDRYFPLSETENSALIRLYPPGWPAR